MGCLSVSAISTRASRKTVLCILIEFIDLYLFFRPLFFPEVHINTRSMAAQKSYRGCLAAKETKIPTALVTVKTENTNYPESP